MPEGSRTSRVSEEFREVLAEEILKLKDPRIGFVTVIGVRVTPDLRHARVSGIGSALPGRVVPNTYFENIVETDDQWIQERTGIAFRRFAEKRAVDFVGCDRRRQRQIPARQPL